ncbi:MAG: hypothetical protein WDO74_02230 [Pseudomonadota bacterium]
MTVISKVTHDFLSSAGLTTRALGGLFGFLLLPACSSNYLTDGVITITTGQEPDAWTVEPAAESVRVEMVQSSRTTLANVAAPVTSVSIGTDGPQNAVATFDATGFDASGSVVMKGSTVPLGIYGFEDAQIALFMGRVGGLSRAPGDLVFPRRHPQVAVLYHGYLLIAGGEEARANLDVYDMALWLAAPKQPALPKAPDCWAVAGPKLLLIDDDGALWLDMSTYVTSAVDAPVSLDFADIIGGETIGSPGDPQYIVGATRATGKATNVVVRVDPDATLHLMKLRTPRLGAAATIVNGQLLVVGGAATGAGAEVSNGAGTGFTPLPFPADVTVGAAMVAQNASTVVLAGGRDPETGEFAGFRTMDLECAEDCTQAEIANSDFAFDHPRLFALSEAQLLAVGEQPKTGETHVFTFDTGIGHAQNEFALRVPRSGASAYLLPNGQVGVLGGYALDDEAPATSVELFFPQP